MASKNTSSDTSPPQERPPPQPFAAQQRNDAIVSLMRLCLEQQHQHLQSHNNTQQPNPVPSNNAVRGSTMLEKSPVGSNHSAQIHLVETPPDHQSAHHMAHLQEIISKAVDICSDVESSVESEPNESSSSSSSSLCDTDNGGDGPSKKK